MVQQTERFSERVVFYVTPTMHRRFEGAVQASGMQPADWLRRWMDQTLVRLESEELVESGDVAGGGEDIPVSSRLAAALAQIEGLEQVNTLLRERLGMADAQNLELNKRLEESHATFDRVTLALPGPAGGERAGRSVWRFWAR